MYIQSSGFTLQSYQHTVANIFHNVSIFINTMSVPKNLW